jgi:hypothetical protein
LFIMSQNPADPGFIPSWWKLILLSHRKGLVRGAHSKSCRTPTREKRADTQVRPYRFFAES